MFHQRADNIHLVLLGSDVQSRVAILENTARSSFTVLMSTAYASLTASAIYY